MQIAANPASPSSLHPLFWIAGISVTLLSLAGIAALTGLLPARTQAEPPALAAPAPAAQVAPVAPVAAQAPAATPAPSAPSARASAPVRHKAASSKVQHEAPAVAALPPAGAGIPPDYVPPAVVAAAPPPCTDCGVIANLREVSHEGKGSGAGAVIGGLAGAVLGSNIGRGNTRTVASIAGAVGGGLLGDRIEKSQTRTTGYEVTVKMDDGSSRSIESATLPSWRIGDKVRLAGGAIVAR